MNEAARRALWARLRSAGVVDHDTLPAEAVAVPWYVQAMVGIAAWIAAIFVLAAVLGMLSGLFRSGASMMAIGLVLCAAGVVVMRAYAGNPFVAQFAFALSLAGQGLLIGGLFSGSRFGSAIGGAEANALRLLLVAALEAGLVLLVPAYVHRLLCALAAALALGGALALWRVGALFAPLIALAFAIVALRSARDGERLALWPPVAAGLALALAASIAASSVVSSFGGFGVRLQGPALPTWAGHAAMTLAFAAVIALLLREARPRAGSGVAIAVWLAAGAVAAAAWFASGLLAAGILLLVAFAIGHEVLVGLGVIVVLATLSRYYYGLEASLLVKSATLCATGVALLAARYGMRFVAADTKDTDRA